MNDKLLQDSNSGLVVAGFTAAMTVAISEGEDNIGFSSSIDGDISGHSAAHAVGSLVQGLVVGSGGEFDVDTLCKAIHSAAVEDLFERYIDGELVDINPSTISPPEFMRKYLGIPEEFAQKAEAIQNVADILKQAGE